MKYWVPLILAVVLPFSLVGQITQADSALAMPVSGLQLPSSGDYAESVKIVPLSFSFDALYEYRFENADFWTPLNTILVLDAFPEEIRRYTLFLRKAGEDTLPFKAEYTINRRTPPPPVFKSSSGDYRGEVVVDFEVQVDNAEIWVCVDPAIGFVLNDSRNPLTLQAAQDSTNTVSVAAYSRNQLGLCSRIALENFRLIPYTLIPSSSFLVPAPEPDPVIDLVTGFGAAATIEAAGWYQDNLIVRLSSANSVVFIAMGDQQAISAVSQFTPVLVPSQGRLLTIPWPKHFCDVFHISFAIQAGHTFLVESITLDSNNFSSLPFILPEFPETEPELIEFGAASLMVWHDLANQLIYSLNGESFDRYRHPVVINRASRETTLQWFELFSDGQRSASRATRLSQAAPRPQPLIQGVSNGGRYSKAMTISIQAASPLRYSLGINQPAPVIDDDSAFFPANLILNANDDQIDNYALRIFDDSQPGKPAFEQVISFSVSGIRPSAPAIRIINAPDLRNAFLVQFELVNEVDIFYSINNPNPEAFRRYVDPVMVQAAGDQRESFLIRAYSIDLFGNRSRLISSFDYIVDPLSIYIDTTRQIADADGSPLKPFNNFDDALAKTLQTGRHSLMVRGAITITLPLLINQDIAIHGGWDEAWNNSRGNSTIILRTTDGSAGGSLQVEGASLSFSNLDIAIFQEKPLPVIDIANGELLAVNTKFELGADCGSHLVKSDNSTITFSGCGFSYEDSLAARLFDIRRTELHCADSEIVIASSVRFFQCLTASDSRVEFSTVNASITPFLGVNSFILNNSALVLKNSQLLVSAGNSTIRFISAYSAQVEMVNTYLATTGSSAVELMNLNGGSSITILASTLINTAASFTCFSILDGSVVVGNSILQSVALSSILLQVGNSRNVFLTANCFSGFDFISQGTLSLQDITALNNLMQSIGTYRLASPVNARALPFKPNFIEAPSTTFLPPVKGMRLLSSNSACIGYAIPLGTAFSGNLGFQGAE